MKCNMSGSSEKIELQKLQLEKKSFLLMMLESAIKYTRWSQRQEQMSPNADNSWLFIMTRLT